MLGSSGTGKSCIALRFVKDMFSDDQQITLGAAYLTQTLNIGDKPFQFDIWDTCGQERFSSVAPMYYRDADFVCLVYDIQEKESYERAKKYGIEVKQKQVMPQILALCGNKCDMAIKRQVEEEEARDYAEKNGMLFYETSAKTSTGIKELFTGLATKFLGDQQKGAVVDNVKKVDKEKQTEKRAGCC